VGTTDGKVLCLNETSGLIVWSYTTGGSVASSPAISENHVLVGTTGTALYSFGPPFPDIALTSVTPTQTCAVEGCLVNVTVVVRNKGEFTETLNITLYANSIPIQTVQVTLAGNSSADVNFRDGLLRGTFLLSAYATPVKYEKDIYNNAAVGGFVKISPIPLTKSLTRKTTLL